MKARTPAAKPDPSQQTSTMYILVTESVCSNSLHLRYHVHSSVLQVASSGSIVDTDTLERERETPLDNVVLSYANRMEIASVRRS